MEEERKENFAKATEEAKKRTEEIMESRHKLLLSVSHDIKAPLSSILGYLELMQIDNTKDYDNSIIKTFEELVGKGNLSKMLKIQNAQGNFEINDFVSNKNKNKSYSNAYEIAKIVQDMKTEFPESIHSEITSAAKDFINVKKSKTTPKITLAMGELNSVNIKEHMLNKHGFYLHGEYDNDNLVKVYFSQNGVEQPLDFKNINYEKFLNSKINEIFVSKNV